MSPALLAATACLLASGAPPELPLPVAHRSEAVAVRTDLGPDWAADVARRVEALRDELVMELSPALGKRPKPRALTLLVFRSSSAYRKWTAKASPAHVSSLGWYDPGRALAVAHTDTVFVALHESSHWVLREVLGLPAREDLPVWVVEGIPCLTEARTVKGLGPYRRFRLGVRRRTSFDPVLGLTATQADLGRGRDDTLYAAGWVTALFLRERFPEAYRGCLAALTTSGDLPDLPALAKTTPDALAKALRRYGEKIAALTREEASRRFPALIPDADRPASAAEVFRQVEFLRHPDTAVQHVAMAWLSNHRHPSIVPALLAVLPEEDDLFRMDACSQIARLAPKKAGPALVDLLASETPAIRLRAIRTLKKLNRRKDLGFHPHDDEAVRAAAVARWREWLRAHEE